MEKSVSQVFFLMMNAFCCIAIYCNYNYVHMLGLSVREFPQGRSYYNYHLEMTLFNFFVFYRLWGEDCSPTDYYNNWRLLYISFPHVHFNGNKVLFIPVSFILFCMCFIGIYISQSSYVRNGEQSLDSLYKPFHFVVYYRYLRFYSDGILQNYSVRHASCNIVCTPCTGTVVYFNSPQEPPNVVGQMKYNVQREGMMFGHYTQTNNTVRRYKSN